MRRVEQASGREPLEGEDGGIDLGIEASAGGANEEGSQSAPQNPPRKRPDPRTPVGGDDGLLGDDSEDGDGGDGADETDEADENEAADGKTDDVSDTEDDGSGTGSDDGETNDGDGGEDGDES
jgi:hypothetical protein